MTRRFLPTIHRLNGGRPLIAPVATHPWENKVTFNPACALVKSRGELDHIIPLLPFGRELKRTLAAEQGLCFVIYRAQGRPTAERDHTHSTMGLAVFSPDLRLLARHTDPVLVPGNDFEDLGVEDGRLARVGDRYVLFYTAYRTAEPKNTVRLALASTHDFVHWEKHGLLKGDFNSIDNKNAMLLEGQIEGKYVMLHRPMEGPDALSIHWAEADDVFGEWRTRGPLMRPIANPKFIDTWVGGGAPPLVFPDGRYLMIYHIGNRKADMSREYDLGLAVIDPLRPKPIVRRDEPFLRPETEFETAGDPELGVNNVVFICGAYFHGDDLYFPYAGADSVVLGGRISRKDILRYVSK